MSTKQNITVNGTQKEVAFVKGNRDINNKNLKQKIASIKAFGQLSDIIVVDGEQAINENLKLEDNEKNEVLNGAGYVVIIDGQHRFKAIQELIKSDDTFVPDIKCKYAYNPKNKSIITLISELNSMSIIWNGSDVVTGTALINPTNDTLIFAKELVDLRSIKKGDGLPANGYPTATISKLLTFSSIINKKLLYKSMIDANLLPKSANVDRAKKILSTARTVGFKDSYLSHRYFIDWVTDEFIITSNIDTVLSMIGALSSEDVVNIININSVDSTNEIREIIKAE